MHYMHDITFTLIQVRLVISHLNYTIIRLASGFMSLTPAYMPQQPVNCDWLFFHIWMVEASNDGGGNNST